MLTTSGASESMHITPPPAKRPRAGNWTERELLILAAAKRQEWEDWKQNNLQSNMIATPERWALIAEYMVSKGVEDRDAEQCSNRWTLLSKQWKKGMGVQAPSPTSPCPTFPAPASVGVGSTSPSSPPHEIPLPPRERPPVLPTRYTQTSETPFPNSTGKEKKGLGKKTTSGEVFKAFSNSTESLSKLLDADMKGKADCFKATMEHTDSVLQLEREKFTHSRQAEQAAAADRAQMVSHFGKMVENLGKPWSSEGSGVIPGL